MTNMQDRTGYFSNVDIRQWLNVSCKYPQIILFVWERVGSQSSRVSGLGFYWNDAEPSRILCTGNFLWSQRGFW
jgi:hypothetical protein